MHGSRSGFSLIEIVIAVTIMGIIAGLVVPQAVQYLRQSKKRATKVALVSVQEAISLYQSDVGAYPQTLEDLKTKPTDEKIAKRWEGPYIKRSPNDAYGRELQYVLNPKGAKPPYELYSWGPDGEGSSEDGWIRAGEE